MGDYTSYTMDELKSLYKSLYDHYMELDCQDYGPCEVCQVFDVCKEFKRVKTQVYLEMQSRE